MDETALEFEGPGFTDADLKAVPNLDKLEMLGLYNTAVTDDGCRVLLHARALEEIAVLSDVLTDRLLEVLARLPALRSLQIHRGPRIGYSSLRYLSGCIELRELYLIETAVTDKGLFEICDLPSICSLALSDTTVSDHGRAALAYMQNLSLLLLDRTRVVGVVPTDILAA
jgi:hypothetical protein